MDGTDFTKPPDKCYAILGRNIQNGTYGAIGISLHGAGIIQCLTVSRELADIMLAKISALTQCGTLIWDQIELVEFTRSAVLHTVKNGRFN